MKGIKTENGYERGMKWDIVMGRGACERGNGRERENGELIGVIRDGGKWEYYSSLLYLCFTGVMIGYMFLEKLQNTHRALHLLPRPYCDVTAIS